MTHSHHISWGSARELLSAPVRSTGADFVPANGGDFVLPTGQDFVREADIVPQYSKHYPTSKIAGTRFEVISVQRYDLPNGGKRDVYTLREL